MSHDERKPSYDEIKHNYNTIRKMTVVRPRTHATTNMTNVKGGRGKEIILKIHLIKLLIMCPFHMHSS